MSELTEPWSDDEDEYEALVNLLVPAAQVRSERTHDDWDALDSKAHGFLALDAAVIAGLVATHELIHRLWWVPTIGLIVAGALFIASVWPHQVARGPDLVDFHDEMREADRLDSAREMFERILIAADENDATMARKSRLLWIGMAVLLGSLVLALPVVLLRP